MKHYFYLLALLLAHGAAATAAAGGSCSSSNNNNNHNQDLDLELEVTLGVDHDQSVLGDDDITTAKAEAICYDMDATCAHPDDECEGYKSPAGTIFTRNASSIALDPRQYEDPEKIVRRPHSPRKSFGFALKSMIIHDLKHVCGPAVCILES
ncbi:hypothetical protein VTN02DRAFT_6103 [Thermoascus thermophilus]